jgi:hypothetical protein
MKAMHMETCKSFREIFRKGAGTPLPRSASEFRLCALLCG